MVKKAIIEEEANVVVVFSEYVHNRGKGAVGMALFEVRKLRELSVCQTSKSRRG